MPLAIRRMESVRSAQIFLQISQSGTLVRRVERVGRVFSDVACGRVVELSGNGTAGWNLDYSCGHGLDEVGVADEVV